MAREGRSSGKTSFGKRTQAEKSFRDRKKGKPSGDEPREKSFSGRNREARLLEERLAHHHIVKEMKVVQVKGVLQSLRLERQMIVSRNTKKTIRNAQDSIVIHARKDLTEKAAMSRAKKDFQKNQRAADSAAMIINREKEVSQARVQKKRFRSIQE
jgi:hypothetical protein